MNLLFDFITFCRKTGAGEYTRRVFYDVVKYIDEYSLDVKLYAAYDSRRPIVYEDLQIGAYTKSGIEYIDISSTPLDIAVTKYKIDRFFIGCAQYVGLYHEIQDLSCDVICVVHDLSYEEHTQNKLDIYLKLIQNNANEPAVLSQMERLKLKYLSPRTHYDKFSKWYISTVVSNRNVSQVALMNNIISMYRASDRCQLIAVSDYTKNTLMYNFEIPEEHIKVLYSPERIIERANYIENESLKYIIDTNIKYFLLVSAKISSKNALKAINAFKKYQKFDSSMHLVTIGWEEEIECSKHINLPFLSDSDLGNAYANCHALLYPTYFEGFGYPPIEALHYGKPVLSSNATSMPEIFGDAPLYFCPLYESAIFNAMIRLQNSDYKKLSEKSKNQYEIVRKKQENDLDALVRMVLH